MNNAIKVVLVFLFLICFVSFKHVPQSSQDDVQFVELAGSIGLKSLLYKSVDTYYPLVRAVALTESFFAMSVFAFAVACFLYFVSVRSFGWAIGSLICFGCMFFVGDIRKMPSASLGVATHSNWVFLIVTLMMVLKKKITVLDEVLLSALSFISALPALVSPAFLMTKSHRRVGVLMIVCLAVHISLKIFLPSDMTLHNLQDPSLLTREPSFNLSLWASVYLSQGILTLFNSIADVRVFSAYVAGLESYGSTSLLFVCGIGWFLLPFVAGFRYGFAVISTAIACYVFSVPTIKQHMLPYPDHGHYLHWVAAATFIGFVFWLNERFRFDVLIDVLFKEKTKLKE